MLNNTLDTELGLNLIKLTKLFLIKKTEPWERLPAAIEAQSRTNQKRVILK
jgi:hypothetical protein